MADITMCTGENCSLKGSCFRYKTEAAEINQNMFLTPPFDDLTNECKEYWEYLECESCGEDITHESESLKAYGLCLACI